MSIGKILGIEIRIDPSWLILFVLLTYSLAVGFFPAAVVGLTAWSYWGLGLAATLLLFASVLIHELSHSVVGRWGGMEIAGITLFIFGGAARLKSEPPSPWVEFTMAAAGPLASVVVGFLFGFGAYLVGDPGTPAAVLLSYLFAINLFLAVFNLAPGYPLDGGRILRAGLWKWTGNLRRATAIASAWGQAIGFLLIALGFLQVLAGGGLGGLWMALIGWFLVGAARQSYQQLVLRQALEGVEVGRVMDSGYPRVSPDTTVREVVEEHLVRSGLREVPVSRDGHFLGLAGIEEIRAVPRDRWDSTPIGELAALDEATIEEDQDAWQAVQRMSESGKSRLLVMRDGSMAGIVSRRTLMNLVELTQKAS